MATGGTETSKVTNPILQEEAEGAEISDLILCFLCYLL